MTLSRRERRDVRRHEGRPPRQFTRTVTDPGGDERTETVRAAKITITHDPLPHASDKWLPQAVRERLDTLLVAAARPHGENPIPELESLHRGP